MFRWPTTVVSEASTSKLVDTTILEKMNLRLLGSSAEGYRVVRVEKATDYPDQSLYVSIIDLGEGQFREVYSCYFHETNTRKICGDYGFGTSPAIVEFKDGLVIH